MAEVFSGHLAWNAARLEFLSQFILALISVRSVNLMEIATAFCSRAKQDSVYRRIQRFFGDFSVCQKTIAQLVVSILSQVCEAPFTLSMDRTNWKLGKTDINILAVGIVHKGYAFPIAWILLPKRGNSNTQERKQVMEKVLKVLSSDQIEMLLADREFIGKEWFKWLIQEKIHFNIRIRDNLKIDSKGKKKHVKLLFRNVKDKEPKHLKKAIHICGCSLFVTGTRVDGEYCIVVTDTFQSDAIQTYLKRWGIETLFGCLKSRGFNLESTHMKDPDKISKLFAILTIAFTWAHIVGEWIHKKNPIKTKKHGRKAKSLFRLGLDFLRKILFNLHHDFPLLIRSFRFLSCT